MNRHWGWGALMAVLVGLSTGLIGCSSHADEMSASVNDNEGSHLTTKPGQALKPEWLLGKWDLDGERTNTANGDSGAGAIASDVVKDVMGKGWKFESGGILKVDRAGGYDVGSWKLAGTNLTVKMPNQANEVAYDARFQDGYLYLKDAGGRFQVFEKDKFFGF